MNNHPLRVFSGVICWIPFNLKQRALQTILTLAILDFKLHRLLCSASIRGSLCRLLLGFFWL